MTDIKTEMYSTPPPLPLIRTLSEHHWEIGKFEMKRCPMITEIVCGRSKGANGQVQWMFYLRRDIDSSILIRITVQYDDDGDVVQMYEVEDKLD